MNIEYHAFDAEFSSRESGEYELGRTPGFVESACKDPTRIFLLMDQAHRAAAYGVAAGLEWERVRWAFGIAARASAAMFAAANASPANPVTVPIERADAPVTYDSPSDESTLNVSRWILGFHLAQLAEDRAAVDRLCQTDPESLRQSSTSGPEYLYLYARALRDFHTLQWTTIVETLLAAIKATDPARHVVPDEEWALHLHVPELEVLMYVVTKDQKFNDALQRAAQKHKKYWSKKKDYRMNSFRGFVSVPLTSLARMGLRQRLPLELVTPYIPGELLKYTGLNT
jgi:hypothetical protein